MATCGPECWVHTPAVVARIQTWRNGKIRAMCGVTLRDGIRTAELRRRLGAKDIHDLLRIRRLRYQGHVARLPDDRPAKVAMWSADEFSRPGRLARPQTTRRQWKEDLESIGATLADCQDRDSWRGAIHRDPQPRASRATVVAREIRVLARGRVRSGTTPLMDLW